MPSGGGGGGGGGGCGDGGGQLPFRSLEAELNNSFKGKRKREEKKVKVYRQVKKKCASSCWQSFVSHCVCE